VAWGPWQLAPSAGHNHNTPSNEQANSGVSCWCVGPRHLQLCRHSSLCDHKLWKDMECPLPLLLCCAAICDPACTKWKHVMSRDADGCNSCAPAGRQWGRALPRLASCQAAPTWVACQQAQQASCPREWAPPAQHSTARHGIPLWQHIGMCSC
jgi:hypothetical protein